MAVETVAAGAASLGAGAAGGVGGPGPVAAPGQAGGFDGALAGQQAQAPAQAVREAGLPPQATPRSAPVSEVPAGPHQMGRSMGDSVLDGVGRLQQGDAAWRRPGAGSPPAVEGPTLKVAMRPPGPAAAPLRAEAAPAGPEIAGQPTTQPGQSRNPGFDAMLQQLEQVSGQAIQVSVVSKTTGSFTGSLNKLLSSG